MEVDDRTRSCVLRVVDNTIYCSSSSNGGVQGGEFNWSIVSRISV